jgi:hypothetical protein
MQKDKSSDNFKENETEDFFRKIIELAKVKL